MSQFLPSEIARLVLGYLNEECPQAACIFEEKSANLVEYKLLKLQNKNPLTVINNMTLTDMLNHYYELANYIQSKFKEISQSQLICSYGDLIKILETIMEVIGGITSNQDDISVVYENVTQSPSTPRQPTVPSSRHLPITPKENGKVNVTQVKVDNDREQKPNISEMNHLGFINLTNEDKQVIDAAFRKNNYVTPGQRKELAKKLGIPEVQVNEEFSKRRKIMRSKRVCTSDYDDSDATVCEPRPSTSYANNNEMNHSSNSQHAKRKRSRYEKKARENSSEDNETE